jgi:hypothetical protein
MFIQAQISLQIVCIFYLSKVFLVIVYLALRVHQDHEDSQKCQIYQSDHIVNSRSHRYRIKNLVKHLLVITAFLVTSRTIHS